MAQADALLKGNTADRDLAHDIRRFVADMPVTLTQQQAMTVELRNVLERQDRPEVLPTV